MSARSTWLTPIVRIRRRTGDLVLRRTGPMMNRSTSRPVAIPRIKHGTNEMPPIPAPIVHDLEKHYSGEHPELRVRQVQETVRPVHQDETHGQQAMISPFRIPERTSPNSPWRLSCDRHPKETTHRITVARMDGPWPALL